MEITSQTVDLQQPQVLSFTTLFNCTLIIYGKREEITIFPENIWLYSFTTLTWTKKRSLQESTKIFYQASYLQQRVCNCWTLGLSFMTVWDKQCRYKYSPGTMPCLCQVFYGKFLRTHSQTGHAYGIYRW